MSLTQDINALTRGMDHACTQLLRALPKKKPAASPIGLCLDDIASTSIYWLWPQRIPLGKLTLLDGSPDCGTSLVALQLAAHVSTGTPWPDGAPCPQGSVLLIAPHDGLQDTILPRLQAAGAELSRIILLTYNSDPSVKANTTRKFLPFSLPADFERLEKAILHYQAFLVLIDPCTAIPGLSRCLPLLNMLAQRTGCTFVLTRSLSRSPADPLCAHGPASPILTAARSRLLLAPDPSDEQNYLLLTPKHSFCPAPPVLSYHLTVNDQGILTLHWRGERDTAELTRLSTGPIHSSQRQAILHFLHGSPTAQPINAIITATSYAYEAGRKMVLRMKQAGELVLVGRGLYTTPGHPCLSPQETSTSALPPPAAVPPVPGVPAPDTSPPAPAEPGDNQTENQTPPVPAPDTSPPTSPPAPSLPHPTLIPATNPPSSTPDAPLILVEANATRDVPSVPDSHHHISDVPPISDVEGVTSDPPPVQNAHNPINDVPSVPPLDSDPDTTPFATPLAHPALVNIPIISLDTLVPLLPTRPITQKYTHDVPPVPDVSSPEPSDNHPDDLPSASIASPALC